MAHKIEHKPAILLRLRKVQIHRPHVRVVPLWVPVAGLASCCAMMLAAA